MALLIFFAVMAVTVSFLCSVLEAALLSITPSFTAQLEEKNPKWHKKVLEFKQDIDTPIAAILTLNTVSHTVGAAGVGAQVNDIYGHAYLGLASGIMTLAILVLSEILPKTIGVKYWRSLIPFMCITLDIMIFMLRPFIYLSNMLMRMVGSSVSLSSTKEEIKALAKIGAQENAFSENKARMIINTLSLLEVKTKDVMTPRTVVHTVLPSMSIKKFDEFVANSPFSRFPIIDRKAQKYSGYIHKSSIYKALETERVEKYAAPMETFYSEAPLETVLNVMLDKQMHIALVVDQHGSWVGIITLEDIIETILGKEIVDETDQVADMRLYAKMKWKKKMDDKKSSQ